MGRGILNPRPKVAAASVYAAIALTALSTLAALTGCFRDDRVAGGSSGVDNPQVIVAFVGQGGEAVSVSGTVSIYIADQNPAADPAPLLKKLVSADSSVALSALDFKGDSARSYNLLVVSDDSSGSLVRGLAYDPVARRFKLADGMAASRVDARLSPLVRYEATLEREGNELVRVVAPGTPFQAVVVDSHFVLANVPVGDTLILHLLGIDGQERPLKQAQGPGGKPRHSVDSATEPVIRPPPPEPSGALRVNAGLDRFIVIGSELVLLGGVEGSMPEDPRLAVLWRQIDPDPALSRAVLESPSSLQTRVTFPWPGFYRFTLSAVFGNHRVEDTVLVGVQPPPPAPVFTDPNPQNYFSQSAQIGGMPFKVNWYAYVPDTLDLQLSRDSGATWTTLYEDVASYGPVERWWSATSPASENCFLRLRRQGGEVVATSTRFAIRSSGGSGGGGGGSGSGSH